MMKEVGPLGLYKGITAPLMGAAMENALIFVAYAEGKRMLKSTPDEELSLGKTAVAASLAG